MKKRTANVFKKHAPKKKLKVLKNYRALSFPKGQTTTAIQVSRMNLNKTIATIIEKADTKDLNLVVDELRNGFREDWKDGETIKY